MTISVENRKFSHSRVFNASTEWGVKYLGVYLGTNVRDQKLEWWGYQVFKKVLK